MTTTTTKPKKAHGEDSAARVQEALSRAAGEVLMKSKLPPAKKAELASAMTDLGTQFADLSAQAWSVEQ